MSYLRRLRRLEEHLTLPTLAQQQAQWAGRPLPKGASRLQVKATVVKSEAKDEARWRRAVWIRDKGCCRWCKRKVKKTIELVPDRGDVHHVSGRGMTAIRWDRRNGLLLCAVHHELLTGKVNEKHLLVPKKTFSLAGVAYANADHAVTFTRIA